MHSKSAVANTVEDLIFYAYYFGVLCHMFDLGPYLDQDIHDTKV